MINEEKMRETIVYMFPPFTYKQQKIIENDYMPHFIFYRKKGANVEAFCTHCKRFFTQSDSSRLKIIFENGVYKSCPHCGYENIMLQSYGYGTGKIEKEGRRNIVLCTALNNDLYIRCFIVTFQFEEDGIVKIPVYDYDERFRYYYGKYGIQKWKRAINWNIREYYWQPVKTASEPKFITSMWGHSDNSYQIVDVDALDKTMFKYCMLNEAIELFERSSTFYFFTYLNEYYRHPNIEYLIKGGFGDVLKCYMKKEPDYRFKIKFKSNDLKEMLGLTSEEIKLLKNKSCSYISDFKLLKKHFPTVNNEMLLETIKRFGIYVSELCHITEKTKLSLVQILNYMLKQKLRPFEINNWNDYLNECKQLSYNVEDSEINRPKNLLRAHQRTTEIIKYEENKHLDERILKRYEKLLEKKCFENDMFIIIPPKCSADIVSEGKALSHCVGGYVNKHASSECDILFLRRKDSPEKPFYTIEVREKEVWQCRGYKNNMANNPVPKEVELFMKEYKKFLKCSNRKVG